MVESEYEILASMHSRHFDEGVHEVLPLKGDGSARKIVRIKGETCTSIGIIGDNIAENRAFISFSRSFRNLELSVPDIFVVAEDQRMYLEEDLGDITVYDWIVANRENSNYYQRLESLYKRIIAELLRFQIDAANEIDYDLCYQTKVFGREQMESDCRYFADMFLDLVWGREYNREAYFENTNRFIESFLIAPKDFFLYRDFQSRNIMIKDDVLYFIDYQSGRKGALQYDIASLLYDAKAEIPDDMCERLLDFYITLVGQRMKVDVEKFRSMYYGFALIRIMQALGAYGNLGVRQKKPGFVSSIPRAQKNLHSLLNKVDVLHDLPYLRELLIHVSNDESLQRYSE